MMESGMAETRKKREKRREKKEEGRGKKEERRGLYSP
jgi:hypothetical protein